MVRDVDGGELPHLDEAGAVRGGWPCRQWPADWAGERNAWLTDFEEACREHQLAGRHAHAKSNFSRLHSALLACPDGSGVLSAREVGWVRRALANTLSRQGAPGSGQRNAVRAVQAGVAAAPDYARLAELLARRLDRYPADSGLASLEPVAAGVSEQGSPAGGIPEGTPIPNTYSGKPSAPWKRRRTNWFAAA
jgi:hypothetical protein